MKYFQQISTLFKSAGLKSAGVYVFCNFFAKGTAFILLFVYSNPRYISVDENGLLNLMGNAVFILMPFLSLGILQSTSVDFFKLKKQDFTDFFTTSFVIPFIVLGLSTLLLFLFKDQLEKMYGFPSFFCYLIPLMAFFSFCNEQYVGLIRNNNQPWVYLKATFVRLTIEVGLSVILVVVFAWRWYGRIAGIMTANVILLIMAAYYFVKNGYLFGKLKPHYLKNELLFAFPVILMQCSIFCLFASDKFFLSFFTNNTQVGIYSYACVFASVIMLFSSAVISYIRPALYQNLSANTIDSKLIKKHFYYYAGVNFAALIGIIVFTPIMYKFFINNNYYPGLNYMYLIAIGYFFSNITAFFQSFMLYHKQKKMISLLACMSIIISLASNYFFIKHWGAFGGAVSVCICYFTIFILTVIISRKNFNFIFINKTSQ